MTAAVPVPDGSSEVDLVTPRRVITSSRAGPSYAGVSTGFRSSFDVDALLRQLFGSSGEGRQNGVRLGPSGNVFQFQSQFIQCIINGQGGPVTDEVIMRNTCGITQLLLSYCAMYSHQLFLLLLCIRRLDAIYDKKDSVMRK